MDSSPALALLAADEPDPVEILRLAGGSPFLLAADHAGALMPRALGDLGLPAGERYRHIAWDIGIARTTALLADHLDAVAILQRYSRLVIDCNRDPRVPSSIPDVSEVTTVPGNLGLGEGDRTARRRAVFEPYHQKITALLDERRTAGRPTAYIAMHSFTPVYKGMARAMQIGVLYNRDTRLAHALLDLLGAEGDLTVGDNAPYSVSDETDYSIPVHGERRGLAHVEIEIRQDLIAEEAGQRAWAARLARLLPAALARIEA
jgi:predicted N-formylglutamate amidohydrolase